MKPTFALPYLYRAVDSSGATIDFLLSETRDLGAARRFFQKAWGIWKVR
jgi:putative transposase